jgi:hypothetical protein
MSPRRLLSFACAHSHLGQWYGAAAVRKNVDGMIEAPVNVFWNVEKKGR